MARFLLKSYRVLDFKIETGVDTCDLESKENFGRDCSVLH